MKKIFGFLLVGLTIFLINCSGKTDKDLYESAKKNLENEKYSDALVLFEELVNEYPNSEYYQDALLETGQLYQGQVDKNISYKESLKKAIQSYRMFYSKYKDDPKAPQTLFMIGFIQANDLGELDSARVTYTKFVELYPDNEIAASARTELENLGLSPDEILAKKIQTKPE
ncbi:MAG: tetratricopeptide repeat protein [Chlorobi bacterium]|nr:tetratricopeptide repeat protein [Chlorobiota bacterium]